MVSHHIHPSIFFFQSILSLKTMLCITSFAMYQTEEYEIVIAFHNSVIWRQIEKNAFGVRFACGHAYFESLSALLESYMCSCGDELPVTLSHSPGACPVEPFSYEKVDVKMPQNEQQTVSSPLLTTDQNYRILLHMIHPEGKAALWWAESEEETKNATLRLLSRCEDGDFFIRQGSKRGVFVLTYIYATMLYTTLIIVSFSSGLTTPRLFLRELFDKEFYVLSSVVGFLSTLNPVTKAPLRKDASLPTNTSVEAESFEDIEAQKRIATVIAPRPTS
eukprot:m.96806 g.96806  ORF g.96806 m.96806 type:complete len:276 (+) comp12475_c5_seq2:328-1155(+)